MYELNDFICSLISVKVKARFAYRGPPDHLSFDSDDEIYVTKQINNICWEVSKMQNICNS